MATAGPGSPESWMKTNKSLHDNIPLLRTKEPAEAETKSGDRSSPEPPETARLCPHLHLSGDSSLHGSETTGHSSHFSHPLGGSGYGSPRNLTVVYFVEFYVALGTAFSGIGFSCPPKGLMSCELTALQLCIPERCGLWAPPWTPWLWRDSKEPRDVGKFSGVRWKIRFSVITIQASWGLFRFRVVGLIRG